MSNESPPLVMTCKMPQKITKISSCSDISNFYTNHVWNKNNISALKNVHSKFIIFLYILFRKWNVCANTYNSNILCL